MIAEFCTVVALVQWSSCNRTHRLICDQLLNEEKIEHNKLCVDIITLLSNCYMGCHFSLQYLRERIVIDKELFNLFKRAKIIVTAPGKLFNIDREALNPYFDKRFAAQSVKLIFDPLLCKTLLNKNSIKNELCVKDNCIIIDNARIVDVLNSICHIVSSRVSPIKKYMSIVNVSTSDDICSLQFVISDTVLNR